MQIQMSSVITSFCVCVTKVSLCPSYSTFAVILLCNRLVKIGMKGKAIGMINVF